MVIENDNPSLAPVNEALDNWQSMLELLISSRIFRAIDGAFADFVYQQEASLPAKVRVCISLVAGFVSKQTGEQHTCVELNQVTLFKFPGYLMPSQTELFAYLQQANCVQVLTDQSLTTNELAKPLIVENNKIYLQRYWQYEVQLADIIQKKSAEFHGLDLELAKNLLAELFPSHKQTSEDPIDWQKVAVALAACQKFSVISGGPGTGKTTTVTKLLALLQGVAAKQNKVLNIQLVAPTGKAAARLTESISGAKAKLPAVLQANLPEQCQTIHRLLGAKPMSPYFKANTSNPLHLDVLVLDEASMVDLPLMTKLFCALPEHAQVILLGDQNQLASVETGSVLADICHVDLEQSKVVNNGLSTYSTSMLEKLNSLIDELPESSPNDTSSKTINGLQDNLVNLVKSHRFSDESGIGQLAQSIKQGDCLMVNKLLKEKALTDIHWHKIVQQGEQSQLKKVEEQILKQLISKLLPVFNLYVKAIKQGDIRLAFNCLHQQQVLCAQRTGYWGVEQLNNLIENELHKQGLIDKTRDFYLGRPIMLNKNDHQLKLFNGDIGIVMGDPEHADLIKVWFITPEGNVRGLLPSRLPSHDTLYAMTIHKSQGSEFESVYLCLPVVKNQTAARGLSRELLYTGLTRARKHFYLYAQPQALTLSLEQQCIRSSGLADRLNNFSGL
ncbi:exodeoxyribonuclease V subunit alpha [Paraglaciecola sp.]|uniref:exodeoxyribonuclease V subunit alpha n=1 Tax=Paraglaciecola sp. TaxID=1920173 RepID=UPI003EF6B71B